MESTAGSITRNHRNGKAASDLSISLPLFLTPYNLSFLLFLGIAAFFLTLCRPVFLLTHWLIWKRSQG